MHVPDLRRLGGVTCGPGALLPTPGMGPRAGVPPGGWSSDPQPACPTSAFLMDF